MDRVNSLDTVRGAERIALGGSKESLEVTCMAGRRRVAGEGLRSGRDLMYLVCLVRTGPVLMKDGDLCRRAVPWTPLQDWRRAVLG